MFDWNDNIRTTYMLESCEEQNILFSYKENPEK